MRSMLETRMGTDRRRLERMAGSAIETDAYHGLEYLSGLVELFVATVRALLKPPFAWREAWVEESVVLLRRCLVPVAVTAFAFGFGTVGFIGASILRLLGGLDRGGTFYSIGGPREFGPFLTAFVVAGVIGTAVCADLGARKIREEIDALATLGVDPISALVAPRFLAIVVLTPLMSLVAIVVALGAGLLVYPVFFHVPATQVLDSFPIELKSADVLFSDLLKCVVYALLIATVSAFEGLHASGGPEGVGRAVNRSVVVAFVGIVTVNFALNSILLAAFPSLQQLR
jgi:phospholipid/cholesterol/gamma-HCH transport system permease protein